MINTKALLKTCSFMFLPTLGILITVFFWFFNITNFINFVTSNTIYNKFIDCKHIQYEYSLLSDSTNKVFKNKVENLK